MLTAIGLPHPAVAIELVPLVLCGLLAPGPSHADEQLGLGCRFLHYSDAGVNGSDTTGADFHMIELRYRF